MGFFTALKAQKAMAAHRKGDLAKARQLYQEAIDEGLMSAQPMLGYALILIRAGEFEKAMPLLLKTQKAPAQAPERLGPLVVAYAACCARTSQLDKGVSLLEKQHNRLATGLTYQTLGYLYVEQLEMGREPVAAEDTVVYVPGPTEYAEPVPAEGLSVAEKQRVLNEQWAAKIEKARKFIDDAVEYDDEDPVALDNKAQFLYRVLGDKDGAKEWFDKAHAEKPGQIDSLWFLSRYDLEKGDKSAAIEKLETALEGNFSPLNYATKAMIEEELTALKG